MSTSKAPAAGRTNGASKPAKAAKPAAAAAAADSNGDAPAPAAAATNGDATAAAPGAVEIAKLTGGKPDAADNAAKMEALKKEIDDVHAKIANLRSILSGSGPSKDTPEGKRRAELRAELDELRGQQAGNKGARGKLIDELKTIQEGVGHKIKALQAAQSKAAFKSPADVDAQIKRLEAQVDQGTMKLVDEKRALNGITQLRKSRKIVEAFATQQAAIDADRARADELRGSLDDPASKAISKRYDDIKAELDALQAELDKTSGSRSKLIEQRTALSARLDVLYAARKERNQAFREANDHYYQRLTAEREKREAAYKQEQKVHAESHRKEMEQQMREEAALPAFAKEIEDCDVLINYFSGKSSTGVASRSEEGLSSKGVTGAKALEVRQVEADIPLGRAVPKKGEEQESYWVGTAKGSKGKGKGRKKGTPLALGEAPSDEVTDAATPPATPNNAPLQVPLGTLTALLALSIPAPASKADLPRVVENLKLKKQYYVSNQEAQTKANIEKVEKALAKSSISDAAPADKEASAPAAAAAAEKADEPAAVAEESTEAKADDA